MASLHRVLRVAPAALAHGKRQLQRAPAVASARFLSDVAEGVKADAPAPAPLTIEEVEERQIERAQEMRREALEFVNDIGQLSLIPEGRDTMPVRRWEVEATDKLPEYMKERTVYITKRWQDTMTGQENNTYGWIMHWNPKTDTWINPLTGVGASADPMVGMELDFNTKEQAINFATKRGLKYEVIVHEKPEKEYGTNYYSHNFLTPREELILQKEGPTTKYFQHDVPDASHYFRPLKYHGDGTVRQHGFDEDIFGGGAAAAAPSQPSTTTAKPPPKKAKNKNKKKK